MANPGFQTINNGFQAVGTFGFQEEPSGMVQQPPGAGSAIRKRVRRKKLLPPVVPRETVIVELVEPIPQSSLQQVLQEMEQAGFDFLDSEEEDDALVLTFILKSLQ